ncbi:cytochrome c oxidase assembly protein subunit 15 [Rhodobacter aestuarii]|uniref:Cytochrome c oxidase assembly protein subunit 15 n=1 Tax=Rhodobacter aestuarii TaxID=453582 RepID=A0A1N7M1Z8_9RHOB|nr:COX15/CtaA family protein [Rhodobacter aestuarii]PTV94789.1 cytochrome c oxidase assembly protein subunit 15 [Rhodobacter aestuarii]SIS80087.1 cytochrome c oxidase assembly protein subunit 15 [Rhodobacter aestuarii]
MGMKPSKKANRALFEEVGVETPKQMPVTPKGGMIDARPKGARGAVAFWMATLVLLALVMLGLDQVALPEPVAEAQVYSGTALLGVWLLGALGLAIGRKFPRGWGLRSLGLGALCLVAVLSDDRFFVNIDNALQGDAVTEQVSVLPQAGDMPPMVMLPATPPSPTPDPAPEAAPEAAPSALAPYIAQASHYTQVAASFTAAQIEQMRSLLTAPVLVALRAGLALMIAGFALWYALLLGRSEAELISARRQGEAGLTGLASGVMHLGFVQTLLGALVSALGAGAVYMDWPLMGGAFLPADALSLEPVWRNFLENQGLVQFMHRIAGYLLLVLGIVAFVRSRRSVHGVTRSAFLMAFIWLALAAILGVLTRLRGDALEMALAHLGVVVLMWLFVIRARFLARYPRVQSIRRS